MIKQSLILLTFALAPTIALSLGIKTPDPTILAKYCFVKSQLPASLKISSIESKYGSYFKIVNSSKSPINLFIKNNNSFNLPKSLAPTHQPVHILKNGKEYYLEGAGFIEEKIKSKYLSNPNHTHPTGAGKNIPLGIKDQIIQLLKERRTDSYAIWEIPFQYYVGEKFIDNRLKIFTKKVSRDKGLGVLIYKLETHIPLEKDLSVSYDDQAFNPRYDNFYYHLKISFKGPETITFIKTFNEKLKDFELIKPDRTPFYLGKEEMCYKLNYENNKGQEEQSCEYSDGQFKLLFNETNTKSFSETVPAVINLPPDEIATLGILFENKVTQLNIIKHYEVNREWVPIDKQVMPTCRPVANENNREKKYNYLKDVQVNYPINTLDESNLVCIRAFEY